MDLVMLILNHLHLAVCVLLCYYEKLRGLYKFRLCLQILWGDFAEASPVWCHLLDSVPEPDLMLQMWPPKYDTGERNQFLSLWAPILHCRPVYR